MDDIDQLDRLLDRTAPPPVRSDPRLERDLAVMAREARRAGGPRRRPGRVLVGAGLSLVLLGGAGTAVAATAFDWAPWAMDPDISYPFALPSGRECEARVQVLRVAAVPPSGPIETVHDQKLTDRFRAFDAIAAADVDGSISEVLRREGGGTMIVVDADGQLSDVPETDGGPTPDDVYAAAVHDALGDALRVEASAYGLTLDQWNTNYAIQCEAAAG